MLFLELKNLLSKNSEAEPEDLLTVLPEGVERNLVADLLSRAPSRAQGRNEDELQAELADLLNYLRRYHLQKSSEQLLQQMHRAEQEGNAGLLQELMVKKIEITRKLHSELT